MTKQDVVYALFYAGALFVSGFIRYALGRAEIDAAMDARTEDE